MRCATWPRLAVSFTDADAAEACAAGWARRYYKLNVKQVFLQAVYYMTISTFLINTVRVTAFPPIPVSIGLLRRLADCTAFMCQSRTQCGRRSARHVLAAGCTASSSPVGLRTVYSACAALQVLQVALLSYGVYLVSRTLMTPQVLLAFML